MIHYDRVMVGVIGKEENGKLSLYTHCYTDSATGMVNLFLVRTRVTFENGPFWLFCGIVVVTADNTYTPLKVRLHPRVCGNFNLNQHLT